MGQKSSKKTDLFITDDVTLCELPDEDVSKFVGRAREYTAVDVHVDAQDSKEDEQSTKKKGSTAHHQSSIIGLLHRAHRKSYQLAFVVPKVKGSKTSTLGRNSLIKEEEEESVPRDENVDSLKGETIQPTHTVFLWRPKIQSRVKKEFSLKKMDAAKTFMNIMMDIEHKWNFSVKDFTGTMAEVSSGEYVQKLKEMVCAEAAQGARLLSVMKVDPVSLNNKTLSAEVTSNGGTRTGDEEATREQTTAKEELKLRMIFLYGSDKDLPLYQYSIECHNTKCTEQRLKRKKAQPTPKSSRETNITWSENWLELFKDDQRLTEVINLGELPPVESGNEQALKSKKSKKPREFQVLTLCFYEKLLRKEGEDSSNDENIAEAYDGLVREVWAPFDNNVQNNLETEAEKLGASGWELCTVLITSHIRMKNDGSEFRKCAIFFQRPKKEYLPKGEMDKSKENILEGLNGDGEGLKGDSEESKPNENEVVKTPPTSPKEKVEKFGVGMAFMKQGDLDLTKLRSTSKLSPKPVKKEDSTTGAFPAVQLKKVDRDKLKKTTPEVKQENVQQVKLRPTDVKPASNKKEEQKEVPWMASLEKKRDAVMKSEEQPKPKGNRPNSIEANGEIVKKLDELKKERVQERSTPSLTENNKEIPPSTDVSKQLGVPSETPAEEATEKKASEKDVQSTPAEDGGTTTDPKENTSKEEISEVATKETEQERLIEATLPSYLPYVDVDQLPSPPPIADALPSPPPFSTTLPDDSPLAHLHLPSPPPIPDDFLLIAEEEIVAFPSEDKKEVPNGILAQEKDQSAIASDKDALPIPSQPTDKEEDITAMVEIVSNVITDNTNIVTTEDIFQPNNDESQDEGNTFPTPAVPDERNEDSCETFSATDSVLLSQNELPTANDLNKEHPKTPNNSPHGSVSAAVPSNDNGNVALDNPVLEKETEANDKSLQSTATKKEELTDPIINAIDDIIRDAFSELEIIIPTKSKDIPVDSTSALTPVVTEDAEKNTETDELGVSGDENDASERKEEQLVGNTEEEAIVSPATQNEPSKKNTERETPTSAQKPFVVAEEKNSTQTSTSLQSPSHEHDAAQERVDAGDDISQEESTAELQEASPSKNNNKDALLSGSVIENVPTPM
ncbi:unnamed protein product [Clavelina lepadiformis]|uniref:Uncharacterized protein n=1 Tax=Clavelina lepadiformis TaxID=159417 RepID=A0ABP0EZL0_CLALP